MKIFIDFDDVIFNTKKFKHDFKNMFLAHGIPNEIFDKYYNDPNDSRAIKTFDPWRQAEKISEELDGVDKVFLTKMVNEYVGDMSAYVFEDAKEFVSAMGNKNVCMVSFGEKEFQTKKVMNSGIGNFIPNIIITDDLKSEEIRKFLKERNIDSGKKLFFLDDRIEQIREVKEKFPQIIAIFIKRPEGRYQEMQKENCCDFEVHNLKEAQEIIISEIKPC